MYHHFLYKKYFSYPPGKFSRGVRIYILRVIFAVFSKIRGVRTPCTPVGVNAAPYPVGVVTAAEVSIDRLYCNLITQTLYIC